MNIYMDKKVIEPVVIKQEAEDNIRIEKRSTRTCISQIEVCGWKENKVSVDDATRTEVAKSICPKYQELEDENAKLLEALNRLLEYGDRMVELYRDSVEKIKSDDGKTEDVKIFQMRLSQGKFYGWRDSMKFLRQAIQQLETK